MVGSKRFGSHIRENNLGTVFVLCFGQAWDQMAPKCQYLEKKKNNFGPNLSVFGPKILFWEGYPHNNREPIRHLFRVENIDRWGSDRSLGKKCALTPKYLEILGQKSIFHFVIAIFVNRAYQQYTRGYKFPTGTTLKKIDHFGPVPIAIIITLNFGLCSTKLGGTVQATKKITHNDKGPGPGRDYGETAVFTFCRKAEIGPNIRFISTAGALVVITV